MRVALVFLLALAFAPAAAAGVVDRAAQALATDPVYVDPAANSVSAADAARLRREIDARGQGPIYIAVLPADARAEAGGSTIGIAGELHRELDRPGVYAVLAGNELRAASTDLGEGEAGDLAKKAFDAHHTQGVTPTLVDFIDRVGAERTGGGGSDGGGGASRIGWFPILIVGAIAFFLYRRFKRGRQDRADFAAVKETAREDLIALAEDVQELEHRVDTNEPAKHDYLQALDQYSKASSAFDRASTPEQLAPVAEALEEGRYLMATAEARLEGTAVPERRPACFFDPRHGPSVRDVEWGPYGGQTRAVPACAACALRVEEGGEPESRQVLVGGQSMPYWAAGPMYGGYFGGFFPGLMLGEMMMMGGFGGFGWGGGFGGYGGDMGGGDGGGDFGGGSDFGDFGGGDFGGGGDGGGGGDF